MTFCVFIKLHWPIKSSIIMVAVFQWNFYLVPSHCSSKVPSAFHPIPIWQSYLWNIKQNCFAWHYLKVILTSKFNSENFVVNWEGWRTVKDDKLMLGKFLCLEQFELFHSFRGKILQVLYYWFSLKPYIFSNKCFVLLR